MLMGAKEERALKRQARKALRATKATEKALNRERKREQKKREFSCSIVLSTGRHEYKCIGTNYDTAYYRCTECGKSKSS